MNEKLTLEEQKTLLRMAREAIEHRVKGQKMPPIETASLTQNIQEQGASFVTLTIRGQLRGRRHLRAAFRGLRLCRLRCRAWLHLIEQT